MPKFEIEEFSPKKAELTSLVDKYKSLVIAGPDDEEGYEIMKLAKRVLAKERKKVDEGTMALRREALDFQNAVLNLKNDLLEITVPREDEMKASIKEYEEQQVMKERWILLPSRRASFKEIDAESSDEELLKLSPEAFRTLLADKKEEFLAERERKIKEEEERLAEEKKIEEAKKEARIEAEKQAKVDADRKEEERKDEIVRKEKEAIEDKAKAVKEAEEKAEKEKQAIIDAHEKEKQDKIDEEEMKKAEKKALIEKEVEDKLKLEQEKKYQSWLSSNEYVEEGTEFFIRNLDDGIVLYKKISTYNPVKNGS